MISNFAIFASMGNESMDDLEKRVPSIDLYTLCKIYVNQKKVLSIGTRINTTSPPPEINRKIPVTSTNLKIIG